MDYCVQRKQQQAWLAIQKAVQLLPQIRDGDLKSKVEVQHALLLQGQGELATLARRSSGPSPRRRVRDIPPRALTPWPPR